MLPLAYELAIYVRVNIVELILYFVHAIYEGWNLNIGNYLFTTDTK